MSFFKKSGGFSYAIANLETPYSTFYKATLVVLPWIVRPAIFNFGKRKKEVYSEFTSFTMQRFD